MRKLLQFACVLLLSSQCFAAIALVQSNSGGSATVASGLANSTFTLTTSAAGYGSPTTSGDLLIAVVWAEYTTPSANSTTFAAAPTTSGFTWTQIRSFDWATGNPGAFGIFTIYYIANAGAMSATTTATLTFICNSCTETITSIAVEFSLYEFSGVATISPVDAFSENRNLTGSPTTVDPQNLTTTGHDLVFVSCHLSGSSIGSGGGYTPGIAASVATVGESQYNLSSSIGSISAAFGGTADYWAAGAVAFKPVPAGSSVVPRHRGWVQ